MDCGRGGKQDGINGKQQVDMKSTEADSVER